jgi:hypothetical protein
VNAIYVLAGDERVGPFTADEIREGVAAGRLTFGDLGWTEGLDGWVALSEILSSGIAEENEAAVLDEGPGYVLTTEALRVREEVFPIESVNRASVETEHTKRGRSIAGSIIFGVLLVIAIARPHPPETTNQWIIWGLSVAVILFLLLRSTIMAFKPSGTFVAVHLLDGDDRVLPMSDREAKHAAEAINEALKRPPPDGEAEPPPEETVGEPAAS